MNNEQLKKTIHNWFDSKGGGSLITPEGWFGRPYDNFHKLTFLEARPTKIIIELDERLYLIFSDLKTVYTKDSELRLENYSQCIFDWKEYANDENHVSIFKSGVFKIVSPPG
jgi:hypothetical protein